MKGLFVFLAALMMIAGGLYAEDSGNNREKITAVSVSGLKRTKPHVIEKPLQKFIGMEAGDIDTNEVIAVVKSSGVLEPESVEITENEDGSGKTLAVTVKEKWSIFPVPFGSYNSSGWRAGGVLMDANAFGLKNQMMVMGLFGSGGLTASVMYFAPPLGAGGFGWNVMGWFAMQENKKTDQTGDETLRRYSSMSIRPAAGLSYSLNEHITPGISFSYHYITLRDSENQVNAPLDGVQGVTLSPTIGVRYNNWDGYFLNEKQASLKYDYTFIAGGEDIHSVSINAAFNHSIIPGFRVVAKSGAVFATPSASPFFESSQTNAAVQILSASYSAVNIAGLSLGFEKYLFKFKAGTVSVSTAYQAAYSHGKLLSRQFDHGAVAMLQMYFSGIAIPGMGLGGSYNVDKNKWQFAFNIGMTF